MTGFLVCSPPQARWPSVRRKPAVGGPPPQILCRYSADTLMIHSPLQSRRCATMHYRTALCGRTRMTSTVWHAGKCPAASRRTVTRSWRALDGRRRGEAHGDSDRPGLNDCDLCDGRDLNPTVNLCDIRKGLLAEQFDISPSPLREASFTRSEPIKPTAGSLLAPA